MITVCGKIYEEFVPVICGPDGAEWWVWTVSGKARRTARVMVVGQPGGLLILTG
jgi:hypothetical protein